VLRNSFARVLRRSRLFQPRLRVAQAVQVGGAVLTIWAIAVGVPAIWWLFAVMVYFLTSCLGMAVGVHRGICHRAFTMNQTLERLFSVFASIGMTGSPLGWVGSHRTHHAHADTDRDPHAPLYHGWKLLWTGPEPEVEAWRVRDILRDPFQRELHRFYLLVVGMWALLLFLIDPLAVVFGFVIPASLQITTTNLSTILAHGHGYRNYETRDDSTNNLLIAVLTWGEGWHNNHHARPRNWSMTKRWWEVDIAGLCIRGLTAIGLIARDSFSEPM
jgi:fatty-acid desaturase